MDQSMKDQIAQEILAELMAKMDEAMVGKLQAKKMGPEVEVEIKQEEDGAEAPMPEGAPVGEEVAMTVEQPEMDEEEEFPGSRLMAMKKKARLAKMQG